VRIGETYIDPQRLVGVYAYPSYYAYTGEVSFNGGVIFVLSETGKSEDWRADFSITRIWQQPEGFNVTEDYIDKPRNLFARRLQLLDMRHRGSDVPYFELNGDRPFMRKLAQLAVEILVREGEERMTYSNAYDQAHVLIPAGFQVDRDSRQKLEKITKKIKDAREKGRRFPRYYDEASFNMKLLNKPQGRLLDTQVDWGDGAGPRTWRERIRSEPMLWGSGPVLPRYIRENIFLLEKQI
jgi:hypothetical protein